MQCNDNGNGNFMYVCMYIFMIYCTGRTIKRLCRPHIYIHVYIYMYMYICMYIYIYEYTYYSYMTHTYHHEIGFGHLWFWPELALTDLLLVVKSWLYTDMLCLNTAVG